MFETRRTETPPPRGHLYPQAPGVFYRHVEAPSRQWQRLTKSTLNPELKAQGINEYWENAWYSVMVRRYDRGFFVKNSPYVRLGIVNADNSARHDWRDFQAIKNDICGRDWEGFELYPAESRLMDPSNEFFLWCVPRGVLKVGLKGSRRVLDMEESLAPQRPFPAG